MRTLLNPFFWVAFIVLFAVALWTAPDTEPQRFGFCLALWAIYWLGSFARGHDVR